MFFAPFHSGNLAPVCLSSALVLKRDLSSPNYRDINSSPGHTPCGTLAPTGRLASHVILNCSQTSAKQEAQKTGLQVVYSPINFETGSLVAQP